MAEGYQEKMDTQMQMLAWHAANLMNIQGRQLKRAITIDQLLGKNKPMSQEDKEKNFAKLIHLMQRKEASHGDSR